MSSKCLFFECSYNKARKQTKSARVKRGEGQHFKGHSKFGRRKSVQTSGRCLLGASKRLEKCPHLNEEEELDGVL